MPSQHPLQSSAPTAQQPQGDTHVPGRLRDLLGSRIEREVYLSTEEAAQLAGRPSREAFIKWARRHNVPLRRPDGGRVLSVKLSDLQWALRVR